MALAKQLVPLSLAQGVDTKTDAKQLEIGDLTIAENVVYDELKVLRKRTGYQELFPYALDNSIIQNPRYVTKFKDHLLLFTNQNVHSYSEALQKFSSKGPFYSVFPSSYPVIRNSYNQSSPDSIEVEGLKVYVFAGSAGGVRYSVLDSDTNSFIVSNDEISATADRVTVAIAQNRVFIIYLEGANVKYRSFPLLDPSDIGSAVTLATNANLTDRRLDAFGRSGRVFYAYNNNDVTDRLAIGYINADGTFSSIVSVTGENCDNAVDVYIDPQYRVLVSYSDGLAAKYLVLSFSSLAILGGPNTIEAIAGVQNISAIEAGASNFRFFYHVSAVASINHYLKKADGTVSGTISSVSTVARSVGLGSKPFFVDNTVFVVTTFESESQATYFVMNENGVVVCKFSQDTGGGHYTHGAVPKITNIDSNVFGVASLVKSRIDTQNGEFFSVLGVNSVELDFSSLDPYQTEVLGDNLHIGGGILQVYDGDAVTEHGFHVYPEGTAAGSTSTTGGSMSDGTYEYVAVYKWTDNFGQDHRSAEGNAVQVVLSGGTATQRQDIVVPTLRLTQKEGVVIELYRTENNGTIFYRVTSSTTPIFNDTTVDSITITDTLSDSQLISRETLYTTGGVLENIAAPGAKIVTSFQRRIVLAGLEDQNLIVYSKIREEGKPVEFNDSLQIRMKDVGGPVTAAVEFGEKLIIFKERAMYFVSGDGPNNLGEQDNYTEPEQISIDVGCTELHSIAITSQGLMFKSNKGIYLLDSGLGLRYIGDKVEDYNNLKITSAKILPKVNQVRFTTSDGVCLVYNYYVGKWCTFTNHQALSAEVIGDQYYYIRPDGAIFRSYDGYTDNGAPIKIRVETGWFSFAQLQGFQRVYKMFILGNFKGSADSKHKLVVSCAYDFVEAYTQQVEIDPEDFIDPTPYGGYSPYGSDSPYGNDGNVYQARIDLKKQKCQSFKFRIEDIHTDGIPSESLSLSAVTMLVGAKEGMFKPSASRKFGTT